MPQVSYDSTELPSLKPRTVCVLIPRDPNFIYVYWDYTKHDIARAQRALKLKKEDLQLMLRVYDLTRDHAWDLNVGFSLKNQYIRVEQDNTDYCVELGASAQGHQFVPLKKSNIARTPPKTSSMRTDLIWQDIRTHKESAPFIKEEFASPVKKELFKAKLPKKSKRHYLTAKDIRDYYLELFSRFSRKGRRGASIENILKERLKGHPLQKVASLLALSEYNKYVHPGSSMNSKGGSSESVLTKKSKFFFEIWTELIVYGRTEADATVRLDQKEIKLNPDGTFSLRYALPDGKIPFDFIAQSSKALEHRHIYTCVERETKNG
jgi:hypothetical protein